MLFLYSALTRFIFCYSLTANGFLVSTIVQTLQLYNNYNPALVAYPNGAVVPVDEPAVQAARAEHFAALGLAGATNGYATNGYAAGFGGLVGYPNGAVVPVDEPAVQAARAQHLAAYNYAG